MRWCLIVLISILNFGCAAMRSTPITRQDDDSYCMQCPANGVPVTIRVPTHLKAYVYEQMYFKITDDKRIVLLNKNCTRNLKVHMEPMVSEKVIFVDVKRPAAGTIDYNLEFDSKGQSITQYESFVFDRTLEDSANLLAQVIPEATQQAGADLSSAITDGKISNDPGKFEDFGQGTPGIATNQRESTVFNPRDPKAFDGTNAPTFDDSVLVRKRIVAFQVFDINAVDFEEQVQSFLAHHLNSCHDCSTNPGGPPDGNPQSHSANGADPCNPVESGSAPAEATPVKSNTGNSELLAPLEDSAAGAGSRE